ncbi:MAG: HAMP domain-containing histidine kinase [Muribaculaceae bacterium]|nr:HAMP domain-containing histidine kinase [Muribaculaceae bacterium]
MSRFFPKRLMLLFVLNCIVLGGIAIGICVTNTLNSSLGIWLSVCGTIAMLCIDLICLYLVEQDLNQINRTIEQVVDSKRNIESPVFHLLRLEHLESMLRQLASRLYRTEVERDREHQLAVFEEKEKIRIKKQLTTNINNELKTPVAAVQVCLEAVLSHKELSDEKRIAFLNRAYDSSMRLRRLLNDVDTISKIEENSDSIKIEKVDIVEIIRKVLKEFSQQLSENHINVKTTLPEQLSIMGNGFLIMSVFHNMLDNTIAYSKATKIEIILIKDEIDLVTFLFSDNGVGVQPQYLKHLFERFYRVDRGLSRKRGGTGLGLSIVKNAVLFHGGTIKAENNQSGGLKFTFSFRKM